MQGNNESTHHLIKYRPDIDGLRAIAVLLVVVFHAFPDLIQGGFIGVDVFFVISGYLISIIIFQNLEKTSFSFTDFYARRVRRIFPALILVLLTAMIFGWFMLTPREYDKLAQHVVGGAGFISNFLLWREAGYFDSAANLKPLLHLWSLGVEEQFYIIWPLLIWIIWRYKNKLWTFILCTLIGSMLINIYLVNSNPVADFYSPFSRFWELLIGAVLAYLHLYKSDLEIIFHKYGNILSIAGSSLILLSAFTLNSKIAFPGWFALFPTLGAGLLIFTGQKTWIGRNILSNQVMVWIGLISFPLYLWHWPLLSFYRIIYGKFPSGIMAFSLIVISLVLAWLTYILIERKIRFGANKKFYTSSLIFLMLAIGAAGYYIKTMNGLESRFSQPPLEIKSGEFDCHNQDNDKPPCIFGNLSSDKLVIIYGDSHAGHLTNALNKTLGNDYKLMFFGENCFLTETDNDRSECQIRLREMRKLSDKKIYAVIRSQRWEKRTEHNENSIKRAIIEASRPYGFSPQKVIIVGSTEEISSDCEFAKYYIPLRNSKCNTIALSKQYNKMFISATRSVQLPDNVEIVYPYEKICPNDVCRVIDGSISRYDDDHHLTKDGALLIMPDVVRILNK